MEYSVFDGLLSALAVMLLGSSFAIPALAVLSELTGMIRQKVFMDKFAMQAARLGLVFGYSVLGCVAGAWAVSFLYFEDSRAWITYDHFWEFSLYLSLLAAGLLSFYYFSWNRLRRFKAVHLSSGILGAVCVKLFLSLLFWAVYRELMTIPGLIPEPDSVFLPILTQVFIISLSGGAALILAYLLIIRNRDDLGRDYYRFALGFGARWAIFFAMISPLSCIWLFLVMGSSLEFTHIAVPGAVYLGALFAFILVMFRIARSNQPMRNKAAIMLCPVLVWVILVFRLVSYLEFSNMVSEEPVVHTFVRHWPQVF